MTPEVAKIVGAENVSPQLADLLVKWRGLVKLSRDEMSKYYDQWDYYDRVYRGERQVDVQDIQARKRGEPEKMIIPFTFGQVQTFVAFGHSLYNQRDWFYEMVASGAEDEKPSQIASAVLERDLHHNKFRSTKLTQYLTDIARFGVGITKETWVHEQVATLQQVPDPSKMADVRTDLAQPVNVPMKNVMQMQTTYLGNRVINVSPYRWFPDVRLPLTRWEEGEFCADEIEESIPKMKEYENQGLVAGLDHVPTLPSEAYSNRRLQFFNKTQGNIGNPYGTKPHYYLITEVQIRLNPAKTEIADGVFLNKDFDYETIYIVWIANDGRIVRISEAGYDHERFSYNCAQFLDDQNRFISFSLCDVLSACQDTATWFLNSRITSVRKTIFNQLVVDPSGIEVDDIIKRSPIIRTKQGRAGSGVDTWIKQLSVNDVTANHLNDVGALTGMAKEATGISETLLGQFASGRRSAREAGNVANNAASRLVMTFASIWESGIAPMGEKMLSNLRQGLDQATMVRIYGQINTQEAMQPDMPGVPPPLFRLIQVSSQDLIGNYDFAVFNGTLPSTRQQTASILQQILSEMQADPRMVMLTGLDPKLIFFEVLNLLNVRNVQRFQLTPERLQQLTQMAQQSGNPGSPSTPQGGGNGTQGGNGAPNPGPRPGPAHGGPAAPGAVGR